VSHHHYHKDKTDSKLQARIERSQKRDHRFAIRRFLVRRNELKKEMVEIE